MAKRWVCRGYRDSRRGRGVMTVAFRRQRLGVPVMVRVEAGELAGDTYDRRAHKAQHEQQRAGPHVHYSTTFLKRRALAMTDTELNVIAALAIIGFRSSLNAGYRTPAATGTPRAL